MENTPPHRHPTPSQPQTPSSSVISTPCKRPVVPSSRRKRAQPKSRGSYYSINLTGSTQSGPKGNVTINHVARRKGPLETCRTPRPYRTPDHPKTPDSSRATVVSRSPQRPRTPGLSRISRSLWTPVASRSLRALRAPMGLRTPPTLKPHATLKALGKSGNSEHLSPAGSPSPTTTPSPADSMTSAENSKTAESSSRPKSSNLPGTLSPPATPRTPGALSSPASWTTLPSIIEDDSSYQTNGTSQTAASVCTRVEQTAIPAPSPHSSMTNTSPEIHRIHWATPCPKTTTPINKAQPDLSQNGLSPPIHWPTPSPPAPRRPPPPGTPYTRALYAPAILLYDTLNARSIKPNLEVLAQHALLEAFTHDADGADPLPTGARLDAHVDALGSYLMALGLWRFEDTRLAEPAEPAEPARAWYRYAVGECLLARETGDVPPDLDDLMAYAAVTVLCLRAEDDDEEEEGWDWEAERALLAGWLRDVGFYRG